MNTGIVYDGENTQTQWSSVDNDKLDRELFYYFYDVQPVGKHGMSFKIGFIDKNNPQKRYSNGKTFTLYNIVNDYEQELYPEVVLNKIKLSDLNINKEVLGTKTADVSEKMI
ncbi:hypothetical protein [Mycoplasma leonicaptivi]|uniref:hypothetical protein n=1 Tax=Mycoplasma leonicaptivi TaxID=36742 RepID=UPI000480602A|nr:hypothetical protein [Mycoplasma leonicaptivi]